MALDYIPSPSWAVIYGETPSADRWSELGENDDALATGAGWDDNVLADRHVPNARIIARMRDQMVKSGVIAGATLGSTGNKTITGVGFMPKAVIFVVLPTDSPSIGIGGNGYMNKDGVQYAASVAATTTSPARFSRTNRCIIWGSGGGATPTLECSYVSMNADGFTINVNVAASNFDVAWHVIA